MKIDVTKIDRHIKFLREQIARLEDLGARGASWTQRNIGEMNDIIATLSEVRRAQQMTTMSGKPLE